MPGLACVKTMNGPSTKNRKRPPRFLVCLGVGTCLALAGASPGFAQSDLRAAQYEDAVQVTDSSGGSGADETPEPVRSGLQKEVVGGLPFTGLDVIALAAVALALISMGVALGQITVPRDSPYRAARLPLLSVACSAQRGRKLASTRWASTTRAGVASSRTVFRSRYR